MYISYKSITWHVILIMKNMYESANNTYCVNVIIYTDFNYDTRILYILKSFIAFEQSFIIYKIGIY